MFSTCPLIVAIVGVHVDGCRLSWTHVLQLRFFEVGGDVEIVNGHHGHQGLPGLNVLAHLDGFLAHDTVYRRDDPWCIRD